MHMISRRSLLAGGAFLLAGRRGFAAEVAETLDVAASEGPVALTRYAADQAGKRPAVIVLHGSRGFELRLLAYQRYADALTAVGIDVYLARYYGPADAGAEAEQITYPGKAHGFDFSDHDPATGDAIAHVVGFFKTRLIAV